MPQPTLTLCPYTTLFRSRNGSYGEARSNQVWPWIWILVMTMGAGRWPLAAKVAKATASSDGMVHEDPNTRGRTGSIRVVSPRDRKSTRLNSSHLGISYAV